MLEDGAARGQPVAPRAGLELLAVWPARWAFVVVAGVEPTDHAAEPARRPAVLWRKGRSGTHRVAGSRFVERMLTMPASCRQPRRHPSAFLVEAVSAAHRDQSHPSLLPVAAT